MLWKSINLSGHWSPFSVWHCSNLENCYRGKSKDRLSDSKLWGKQDTLYSMRQTGWLLLFPFYKWVKGVSKTKWLYHGYMFISSGTMTWTRPSDSHLASGVFLLYHDAFLISGRHFFVFLFFRRHVQISLHFTNAVCTLPTVFIGTGNVRRESTKQTQTQPSSGAKDSQWHAFFSMCRHNTN